MKRSPLSMLLLLSKLVFIQSVRDEALFLSGGGGRGEEGHLFRKKFDVSKF